MAKEEYKIYSSIDPLVGHAGDTVEITVSQSLQLGPTNLLNTTGPTKVELSLQGPQLKLTEADISGVYPAPGSTDSPDNFLPHIALSRRTLPWERRGPADTPAGQPTIPWLALLVLTESDLRLPLGPIILTGVETVGLNESVVKAVQPVVPAAPAPPASPRAAPPIARTVSDPKTVPPITVTPVDPATIAVTPSPNPITIQRYSSPPLQTTDTTVGALKTADPKTYAQLIKNGQATAVGGTPSITDATTITTLAIPNTTLKAILPAANDLAFLCNAKEVFYNPDESDAVFTSIVVSCRLPDAGDGKAAPPQQHMAVLVSLERRDDIYTRQNDAGATTLVVLHSWMFTPSKGADFEEVCQAIGYRPNGGVLRFGNLPKALSDSAKPLSGGFEPLLDSHGFFVTPLEHTEAGTITWRGPLRPFPPPPRSAGVAVRSDPEELAGQAVSTSADYSHATAFELGKLLALADTGIREDLRDLHRTFNFPQNFVDVPAMLPILQQRYWGEDIGDPLAQPDLNAAMENPWAFAGNQSMVGISSQLGDGNSLGLSAAQLNSLATTVLTQLNQAVTQMGAPAQSGGGLQMDINTINEVSLAATFPELVDAGSIVETP